MKRRMNQETGLRSEAVVSHSGRMGTTEMESASASESSTLGALPPSASRISARIYSKSGSCSCPRCQIPPTASLFRSSHPTAGDVLDGLS